MKEWEKQVKAAESSRLDNLDVMNIYLPNISQGKILHSQGTSQYLTGYSSWVDCRGGRAHRGKLG